MTCKTCPVREQTADGDFVGRCDYYLNGTTCPRHGDVSLAVERYQLCGLCTPERELHALRGDRVRKQPVESVPEVQPTVDPTVLPQMLVATIMAMVAVAACWVILGMR